MLKNWINIFIYHLKNNKLFTALNVLGLSIGIAGIIFATLYWNDEQNYDQWNLNKDSVFQSINRMQADTYWASNVAPLDAYFKTDFPEVETHCYMRTWYYEEIVQYKDKKEIFKITDAQKTFFKMFPFSFTKGSAETALKDNTSIAISEETAAKLFGTEDPINKTVIYDKQKLVVNGVYKIPGKSSVSPDAVINLIDKDLRANQNAWGNYNYGLLLKLKNPDDKEKVTTRIEKMVFQNGSVKWAKGQGISIEEWLKKTGEYRLKTILEPLEQSRLHSLADGFPEGKGNYQFLLIMVGLSILILLLSLVNYINLATASAIKRAKEVGVRKIVGASKQNIIKQFVFETVLISLFAIFLALVLVELSLPYYNDFLNKKLVIYGGQFYRQLVFIFVITVLLAGIFPAVYVSNFETLKVLKGNFNRSKSGVWLRNGMLVFQFAIASFFIIGSYIVYQQVQYISNKELVFKGEQVLSITYRSKYKWGEEKYSEKKRREYKKIKAELAKIKGVKQVATGAFRLGPGYGASNDFVYKNSGTIQGRTMAYDFGLLSMLQIQIKQGRDLSEKLASDTINSMLVNETALKMMGEKEPLGKEVTWQGQKLKIVGVVKDFNLTGPQEKIPPMVFFHLKTVDWLIGNVNTISVKIDPENIEQTIADIEKFWVKNVDSEYPFHYDFVDKEYARTYETYVKQKNLFSLLNVIVILIALFGLFSLASFSIQRRMKEIAIRKTLGAETSVLLKELSKQYLVFCVIGFLMALFPVYYLLNLWLENFAFRIDISVIPFLIGFVVLLILTLIVVLSRAYQATQVEVLNYLKYE
jgi:putative ABC transport system permease protein